MTRPWRSVIYRHTQSSVCFPIPSWTTSPGTAPPTSLWWPSLINHQSRTHTTGLPTGQSGREIFSAEVFLFSNISSLCQVDIKLGSILCISSCSVRFMICHNSFRPYTSCSAWSTCLWVCGVCNCVLMTVAEVQVGRAEAQCLSSETETWEKLFYHTRGNDRLDPGSYFKVNSLSSTQEVGKEDLQSGKLSNNWGCCWDSEDLSIWVKRLKRV